MGVEIVEGKGHFWGIPFVEDLCSAMRGGDAALPKLRWDFLFSSFSSVA